MKFAGSIDVLKVSGDSRNPCPKRFCNLTLGKPDCIPFDPYIYTGVTLWGLIYYELRIVRFHIQMLVTTAYDRSGFQRHHRGLKY